MALTGFPYREVCHTGDWPLSRGAPLAHFNPHIKWRLAPTRYNMPIGSNHRAIPQIRVNAW